MKKNIFIWAGTTLLAAICGCAITGGSGSSVSPRATIQEGSTGVANILKFEDVPVPAGFKLIDKESFTFQNDQMRVGLLKYTGLSNASKVVDFYKEQMPIFNWDMINIIDYEQKIMNFERADEDCIVTIQPTSMRTAVAIAISPKASTRMTEEKVQRYKELKIGNPKVK